MERLVNSISINKYEMARLYQQNGFTVYFENISVDQS